MARRSVPLTLALGLTVTGLAPAALAGPGQQALAAQVSDQRPIYLDTAYSPQERAADLVSRMTLAEKASQMNSSVSPAIPRLGIAQYGWWNEALHGVAREQLVDNQNATVLNNTTSYPLSLSLGSTWDPALQYTEATAISDEAREVVKDNKFDLDFYSPTINLARDPRWGRTDESFSEDPLLTTKMANQFVNGMEGKTPEGKLPAAANGYYKTLTTIKHYAANNSEYNRLGGDSVMSDRDLREYYTKQFRDVIKDTQPGSIMSSYNKVNGVPAAASTYLIDNLARQTFGFQGYFTSDCDAIWTIQQRNGGRYPTWIPQGYDHVPNQYERHALASAAGEDLDCNTGYHDAWSYANTIPTAVAQKIKTQNDTFNENDVDLNVLRLFTARISLGEFDAETAVPWIQQARQRLAKGTWVNSDANDAVTQTPERLALARKVGAESIVLLENDTAANGSTLLPLKVPASGAYKVAVIGWYGNPPKDQTYLGGYSADFTAAGQRNIVSGYEGLKSAIEAMNPGATVDYLKGTESQRGALVPADVAATAGYDAVVVYVGNDHTDAAEDKDRTTLTLPGSQEALINQVAAVNPNTIVYMETIGQVNVESFKDKVPAMLWSSFNAQRRGEALADVVLGTVTPGAHLPFTWYRSEAQLPPIGDYDLHANATSQGRTYMYFTGTPTYPFGYGLSYTSFELSKLRLNKTSVDANDTIRVRAEVENTGATAGAQVAQLYVTTPDAPAAKQRPIKRLVAFEKVALAPGESTHVNFDVKVRDLAFYDEAAGKWVVDTGRYGFELASSATDVVQTRYVTVSGALDAVPSVVTAKPVVAGADEAADIAQRLVFPVGATVDPQLTVSLSDDRLFGYILKGRSTALPAGMTVKISSNRSNVVRVDSTDTIRAVKPGAATITAQVSYNGEKASGSFVVYVK
ncbi:glycoside hydrolase family 3 C-terminal domain-containing protein [Motilibacter aurantiacus]|uniref:glycoside hydrolase family 3 C-terminal domain-containing protein n=1 Tax=Motilibacter aurantiacus TaxID=2714955 RepID=UPI00140AE835|nr:glycoside hydrolase family 3 C-terminal domain-containing protein [Motilibacter aurantiacus]NHC46265.1 family 3 glycosyl hydrolase [Motilibacter aurantiacus]